jgi:hypothetical protein
MPHVVTRISTINVESPEAPEGSGIFDITFDATFE